MSDADNTPDFDSMSPEELMAWMETLAERQRATKSQSTARSIFSKLQFWKRKKKSDDQTVQKSNNENSGKNNDRSSG